MYNRHKTFEECLEMDIESIFSRDNYDEVVSRAYAYNHSMYKIFKVNIYHYTNYINKSPLASWYFKYFDIGGPLKPYISMNKYDILHHVDRLKPYFKKWAEFGVLAVEMETAALYTLASKYKAKALSILTISDSSVSPEITSSEEREKTFNEMIELALETAIK